MIWNFDEHIFHVKCPKQCFQVTESVCGDVGEDIPGARLVRAWFSRMRIGVRLVCAWFTPGFPAGGSRRAWFAPGSRLVLS